MTPKTRHFLLASFILCLPAGAWAADSVAVRHGAHEGYSRLVFDWPADVNYTVTQDGKNLKIVFDKEAALDLKEAVPAGDPLISAVTAADGKTVTVGLGQDSDFRHFKIGKKIIVDVLRDGDGSKPAPVTPAQKTPDAKPEKKPEPREAEKKIEQLTPHKAEPVQKTVLEKAQPVMEPHVVTVSLTEAVGMAAFERNGNLWIVLDRPDVTVPPELAGLNKDAFPPMKRYELKGGVAYRLEMPPQAGPHLYGEGGGLIWRVVITPHERDVKPAAMERSFGTGKDVRGGMASWTIQNARQILDVPDPSVGDILKVVTVSGANQFAGQKQDFVDFEVLHSAVGIAVKPKVDDLSVKIVPVGIEIGRPQGLALSRLKDISQRLMRRDVGEAALPAASEENGGIKRIYDFDRWMLGGLNALNQNQHLLLSGASIKDPQGRLQDVLTLAKMNIANDRGAEALGFLEYAVQELPALADGVEFRALRGAANALAGRYEAAMEDFLAPALKDYPELDFWRAYSLASLEDWQQAEKVMPPDNTVLLTYPQTLLEKLGLKLAEAALRAGDVRDAESILSELQKHAENLPAWSAAGLAYLQGEAARQSGQIDGAKAKWEPLTKGTDDLYRAKAGLAMIILQLQKGEIKTDAAIDRLEALRYAWRGDELEAQVNFMLGKLYLDERRYLKGFGILRDAASLSPDSDTGREITAYMMDRFKKLLLEDDKISALDAVTVYEEFTELTPTGDDGNRLVQKLADRLVEADLPNRASGLLQHQVDYRVDGAEKANVSLRLAAVYLLNDEPEKAIAALNQAKNSFSDLGPDKSKDSLRKIELMRARALSDMNKTEEALTLLATFDPAPDVNRLRADIAFQAGLWEDAAEALQDLILDQALDLNRPLTKKQSELVLNRAVALNLSGNRVALANMRKRYGDAMNKTEHAKMFDVVTRPRQSTLLADQQTLQSIVSEVDVFKDFLESYRNDGASN